MTRLVPYGWADVPAEALALFGGDFFSTAFWYDAVVRAALPPGASAVFYVAEDAGRVAGVVPLLRQRGVLSSLTTPYTCLWQPLLARGADAHLVGRALAALCKTRPVRLDALDTATPAWVAGLRAGGVRALPFDHFGNWVFPDAGTGWDAYLASRPGNLREAIRRRTKKLLAAGGVFRVVHGGDGLEAAIAAYERMHDKSWKSAEPFPLFNATLMRACAAAGCLRLGVLSLDSQVLAAQFWVVFGGTGMVLKLAHDAAADAWSPGTVLMGLMVRHMMTEDGVGMLDFGRGDDDYKKLWMCERRQRSGLILAYPWRPRGALEIVRRAAGDMVRGR